MNYPCVSDLAGHAMSFTDYLILGCLSHFYQGLGQQLYILDPRTLTDPLPHFFFFFWKIPLLLLLFLQELLNI